MIIYTTNILAGPVLLLVWGIDLFLLLAGIRVVLARISAASSICHSLQQVTDPLPNAIGRWIAARRREPAPRWLPWLIVALAALIVRQLLALLSLKIC
jgi:hypothetical protein